MSTARQSFVIVACGLVGVVVVVVLAAALAFASPQTTLQTISPPVGIAQTITLPATDPATGRSGTNVTYVFEDGTTAPTFFFPDPQQEVSMTSGDIGRAAGIGGAVGLLAGLAAVSWLRHRTGAHQAGAAAPG